MKYIINGIKINRKNATQSDYEWNLIGYYCIKLTVDEFTRNSVILIVHEYRLYLTRGFFECSSL